jgi:hypothetical protein
MIYPSILFILLAAASDRAIRVIRSCNISPEVWSPALLKKGRCPGSATASDQVESHLEFATAYSASDCSADGVLSGGARQSHPR